MTDTLKATAGVIMLFCLCMIGLGLFDYWHNNERESLGFAAIGVLGFVVFWWERATLGDGHD